VIITIEEYEQMHDASEGKCRSCGAYRDMTEPDAENYDCPECCLNTVDGCDVYLTAGRII